MRLSDFEGTWSIDRQIDDRRAGRQGQLTGTAIFSADGQGLRYTEQGVLHFAGDPALEARQTYLWREDGDGIAVLFSNGRGFHHIPTDQTSPSAHHDCTPDIYKVSYDFSIWPDWTATWQVTGPRKDYTMTTRYRQV